MFEKMSAVHTRNAGESKRVAAKVEGDGLHSSCVSMRIGFSIEFFPT